MMPRYFFNIVVRGRKAIPDPEGDELSDDTAARKHGRIVAQEMLRNRDRYRSGLIHWTFEITDALGRQVGRVPFSRVRTE